MALIDLLVDLRDKEAVPELRKLSADGALIQPVRARAERAIERLQ
jgi:hypothetical protein